MEPLEAACPWELGWLAPPSGFQVGRVFLSLFSFSPSPAPPPRQLPLFQFYLLKVMTLPRLRPPPCDGLAAALSVTSVPPSPASFSLGMPHCFEDKVQAPSSVCEAAWPGRPSPCQRHGGRRVDDVLHPEAPSAAALPPRAPPPPPAAALGCLPGTASGPRAAPCSLLCDPGQVTRPFGARVLIRGAGQG